jgi:hypothetical protein
MRQVFKMFCFLCLSFISCVAFSQDHREAEVTRLESLERESVMKGDSVALFSKLWSPNMVINTPANIVGTVEETKRLLRSGGLQYVTFERTIQKISINDNVAVVLGEERVRPQGQQPNAGKLVTRRFMNVWMFSDKNWSIIARQATIIKVE